MSRDAVIESWLASMSESELIAQCLFWHDTALEHGRMYNAVNAENAKLRELVSGLEYCVQGHICDCCPLYDQSGTNRRRCESLEHELGIEVPE